MPDNFFGDGVAEHYDTEEDMFALEAVESAVDFLAHLADEIDLSGKRRALELGIGTGRITCSVLRVASSVEVGAKSAPERAFCAYRLLAARRAIRRHALVIDSDGVAHLQSLTLYHFSVSFAKEPIVRHAVRVLLVDDEKQLLLFRALNPDNGLSFWCPPGGGIESNETAHEALARELLEETGLTNVAIDAEIWTRRHVFAWRDDVWDQRERWFLAHVSHFSPDTRGLNENEMADIAEWRWWAIEALASSDELFVPKSLAVEYQRLLSDGPPPHPIMVGE